MTVINRQLIRVISKRYNGGKAKTQNENEPSLLKMKLQELAENAQPNNFDPKAGVIEDALPYNKIELHRKLDEITNNPSNFNYKYQQALGITTIPNSASKHDKEIAMNKPWTGEESLKDSSLRMLNDSIKPLKTGKRIITPPKHTRVRIHDAREGALDYQLNKISEKKENTKDDDDDDDNWGEMYKERLLGPTMLLNDSFSSVDNSIRSLADQRIMDAKRRGEFKNIKRGKPIDGGYSSMENMFIDRTEYHLNEILKKQDALPPWIEKQGGCELRIKRFRQELDKDWIKCAVNTILDMNKNEKDDTILSKTKIYVENELNDNKNLLLRNNEWVKNKNSYLESMIRDLNDSIRGYNLQAPLASQKMYLLLNKELNSCYKRCAPLLITAVKRSLRGDDDNIKEIKLNDAVSYNGIPQRTNIVQRESESLWSMFRKVF